MLPCLAVCSSHCIVVYSLYTWFVEGFLFWFLVCLGFLIVFVVCLLLCLSWIFTLVQTGLKLMTLLPQPPESLDNKTRATMAWLKAHIFRTVIGLISPHFDLSPAELFMWSRFNQEPKWNDPRWMLYVIPTRSFALLLHFSFHTRYKPHSLLSPFPCLPALWYKTCYREFFFGNI